MKFSNARSLFFACISLIVFTSAASAFKGKAFLENNHWDKGNAEYQLYDLTKKQYGADRQSKRSTIILVKEPWNKSRNVKSSKNADTSVLKFTTIDFFRTGTYDYSYNINIFFDIKTGRVIKYLMSSHDGCGNSFMYYKGDGTFLWHSYWNDHGLIEKSLSTDDFDTFYDALPVYLRFRLDEPSYEIKVVQGLIGNHPPGTKKMNADQIDDASYPKIVKAQVTSTKSGGSYVVKVVHGKKTDTYEFEAAFPHRMKSMKAAGKSKTMYLSKFFPYWQPKIRGANHKALTGE